MGYRSTDPGRSARTTTRHVSELLAATNAVNTGKTNMCLNIDNTAAAQCIRKGHSTHYGANVILRRMYQGLPRDASCAVRWVPTECQWADALARETSISQSVQAQARPNENQVEENVTRGNKENEENEEKGGGSQTWSSQQEKRNIL